MSSTRRPSSEAASSPASPTLSSLPRPSFSPSTLQTHAFTGFHQPPQSTHRRPLGPVTSTRGLAPVPGYSEDWLDQNAVSSQPLQAPNLLSHWDNLIGTSQELEETEREGRLGLSSNEPDMLSSRARQRRASSAFVDLTDDQGVTSTTSPQSTSQRPTRKRRSIGSGSHDSHTDHKRLKPSSPHDNPFPEIIGDHEKEILIESPRAASPTLPRTGENETDNGSSRIGRRTCVICMEPYTNATVTACGHIFCHECLVQALMAGEKAAERGIGNCPVCRKSLPRRTRNYNIIPMLFMKKSAYKGERRPRSR